MSPSRNILMAYVLFSSISLAQLDRTSLNGTVTDSSGAAVPGAIVQAKERSTGLERSTIASTSGTYSIAALPAGKYIELQKAGFDEVKFNNVVQAASQTRTLNVTLQIAAIAQTVDVTAQAALDATNATLGGNVEPEQIHEIPQNGRNWSTLEELVPGAVDTGVGNQKSIRFNGQGNDDINFELDGTDFSGIQNQAPKSALRLQISTEAIQEFTIDTATYTAENGGSAGAQINVVSKSGTNDFRGSLFEYLRNSYFDARSPFNPTSQPQPPFRLNQFGADLGGPIVKDKTFFFMYYEGFRQVLGLTDVGFVPTTGFRSQVAAAQPALANIINSFPLGNGPLLAKAPNIARVWSGSVSSPVSENAGMLRLDQRFNDANTAYARYNIDDGNSTSPLGAVGQSTTVPARLQNGLLGYLHVFSPTLLNEVRAGFDRNYYSQYQNSALPANYVIPDFSELYESYGKVQASTSYDERDDITKTAGRQTIRAGVEVRRVQINEANSNLVRSRGAQR